jgi:metallo-beta-lactamase class B
VAAEKRARSRIVSRPRDEWENATRDGTSLINYHRRVVKLTVALLAGMVALAQSAATLRPDPPHKCFDCDAWNRPHEPFKIFGNTYFVGVAGLSSILIAGNAGLVLLDAGLPQSAPLIDANIRKLGFKTEDIRLIVNSHAHYDHAGGIAALQRASGAQVSASAAGKLALERGEPTPDDPQFAFGREANAFPAVKNVRAVTDGETLRVGDIAVTAHGVPGHTPGATTWTWRSCEGSTCKNIVYADSLNAVSAPEFRFTAEPSRVAAFRKSIEKVGKLPCDVMVPVHPVWDKARALQRQACAAYAAAAGKRLDGRIFQEARQ